MAWPSREIIYTIVSPNVAPRCGMKLTQQLIKDTPAPAEGRQVLTDGRGLQLRITSSDKRTWSLQYRVNGRMLKTTIGAWPAVSISEARKLADGLRNKLAKGIDPQEEKKNAKIKGLSFEQAWIVFDELYISELKARTAREYRRSANINILPKFKNMALTDVTKSDLVTMVDTIRKRAPVMANRTLALLSKFYNWCLGRDYVRRNLISGIPKAAEAPRNRVLTLQELRSIYNAASELSPANELFIKLLLLTGQRQGVIAGLRSEEIRGCHLEISGDRNKSGERIKIPLAKLSSNLIMELGIESGPYVVSTTKGAKAISGFSKLKKKLNELTEIEEHWTFHDIRGGITTYLEENGLDRIYTTRILNHKDQSVTGIYARPDYGQHLEWVFEKWSKILTEESGMNAPNILSFAKRA